MNMDQYRQTRRILILGHSYVRRLGVFVQKSKVETVNPNFNLCLEKFEIRCAGYGGAGIARMHEVLHENLTQFRPELVILQIGSNDIGRYFLAKDVTVLASGIIELAERIHYSFHVPKVVVSQLFFHNR